MKNLHSHQYKVQGHRGSKATHPENTLPAFHEAYLAGADRIELDLQLSQDDEVVIFHDSTFNDRPIHECKAAELGAPLFQELCEKLQQEWKISANLEIKPTNEPEKVAHKVVEMVKRYDLQKSIYYSSFDHGVLAWVKKLDPSAIRGLAILKEDFVLKKLLDLDVQILSPDYRVLDVSSVKKMQQAGFTVAPWTVNGEENWKKMVDLGVDEIITDSPRELLHYLTIYQ